MKKLSMSGLYTLTEWITKFVYVNMLWIGFSILGLVVFGVSPATAALFTVIRKWIMGEQDIPVFGTFWKAYKGEFLRSNGLGMILALAAGLIMADLYYMKNNNSNFLELSHIPLYLFIFAVVMTALYVFPVYAHYNVKFIQTFKNAFLIMLINPIANIAMILGLVAAYFIMKALPALFFFFGASFTAGMIMATCYMAFTRIENKQREAKS